MAKNKKNEIFVEKIYKKVCRYRNYLYLCIRNQEISSESSEINRWSRDQKVLRNKEFRKKSLQKVLEKFGGLKKMLYLCTTFRFEITKWFFKWFFDLLVIIREKIVVFICQFL